MSLLKNQQSVSFRLKHNTISRLEYGTNLAQGPQPETGVLAKH
jgi:hypothetical protein